MEAEIIEIKVKFDDGKNVKAKINYDAYVDMQKLHGRTNILDDILNDIIVTKLDNEKH